MTTSINTNISAYFAQNNLRTSSADAQSSIARLSSGNSIIRASDDVAGLSIGTVLRTDVSTLGTALSNASQASSLIQVADGAIQRLGEILQRQKALAVQGNADTLSDTERGYLDQEFTALTSEYERIVQETNFNGIALLNGNLTGTAQDANVLGADGVATTDYTVTADGTTITALTIAGLGTDNSDGADAIDAFFADATRVATITADVPLPADYTFDTNTQTLLTALVTSGLGTDAAVGGDAVSDFIGGLATATAAFSDSNTTDDAIATLTIVSGGITFVSAEQDFSGTPGDVVLTDATSGATLTITLASQTITDTTSLTAASSALQTAVQAVTGDDSAAPANATTASISIVGGTTTFANTAVNLADSQGAVTFTDATSGATITLNFGDLGITDAAGIASNATAIQTAINALTAENGYSADAVTGAAAFQVGTSSTDTISVSISNVDTATIGTDVLSVGTKAGSIAASAALDAAIDTLTSVRAEVGAVQSRFNFASSTLETSIQNLDAARAGFLDADISAESTAFASQQVLIQASISVLAQANQLPQNLLKLIG